jgi:hypothetical protein
MDEYRFAMSGSAEILAQQFARQFSFFPLRTLPSTRCIQAMREKAGKPLKIANRRADRARAIKGRSR